MADDIDDPIKGIAFTNELIRKNRMYAEEARLKGDVNLASKYDFYLTKLMDILQHFIRESHQEGRSTEDISTRQKRVKVNASE